MVLSKKNKKIKKNKMKQLKKKQNQTIKIVKNGKILHCRYYMCNLEYRKVS